MFTGTLKQVSNRATWIETIQLTSINDDEPLDLSEVSEITLTVWHDKTQTAILQLKYTEDAIIIPVNGIIQWRAEAAQMNSIGPGTYQVGILINTSTDAIQFFLGRLPVVGGF